MENQNDSKKDDDIILRLMDKRACDAYQTLQSINKDRTTVVKSSLMQFYNKTHQRISYEEYVKIANETVQKSTTNIVRKSGGSMYDLDDLDDF